MLRVKKTRTTSSVSLPSRCLVLLCFASQVGVTAIIYSGQTCDGFVTFALSSYAETTLIDYYVEAALETLPIYLPESCRSGFRRYACISTYTPYASDNATTMCSSVCSNILNDCLRLFDASLIASESLSLLQYELEACQAKAVNTDCTSGNSTAYNSEDETVCPYYTIIPDVSNPTYPLLPSACAFQCPGAFFNAVFNLNEKIHQAFSPMCFLSGFLVAVRYGSHWINQRRKASGARSSVKEASVLPIFMFCIGCVTCAGVNIIVLLTGGYTKMICDDSNSLFSADPPLCIVQGACIALSMLWTSLWSLIIGFELFSQTCLQYNEKTLSKVRAWYLHGAVGYIIVLGVPGVYLGNIDTYIVETAPYCFFDLDGVKMSTLFLFWIPLIANVLGGATMMICVLLKIRRQEILMPKDSKPQLLVTPTSWWKRAFRRSQPDSSPSEWKRVVVRKLVSFVLIYDLAMLFIIATNFTVMLTTTKFNDNIVSFFDCLFTKSITSKEDGLVCGNPSSLLATPLPMLIALNIVMSGYGLIPFLIFGLNLKCHKRRATSSTEGSTNSSKVTPNLRMAINLPLTRLFRTSGPENPYEVNVEPAGEPSPSSDSALVKNKLHARETEQDAFYHVNPGNFSRQAVV